MQDDKPLTATELETRSRQRMQEMEREQNLVLLEIIKERLNTCLLNPLFTP